MTVFLVHSTYHIFYAISIAKKSSLKKAIILCSSSDVLKFHNIFKIIERNFPYEIKSISHNDLDSKLSTHDLMTLQFIKSLSIDELIIFNQDNLLAIHLAKFFYRRSKVISLAQDGLKAYAPIKKLALKYIIQRSIIYFRFTRLNGLEYSFFFVNLKYANFSFINRIYLSHPRACLESNKPKIEVNLDNDVLYLFSDLIKGLSFDFHANTLLFTSSILKYNYKEIGVELLILKELEKVYPSYQKIIKLHPRAKEDVHASLKERSEWKIIKDNFPAELLINSLKANIALFSGYSSVALYQPIKSDLFKSYWLYPLYKSSKKPLQWLQINKPSEDIILINTIDQLRDLKKSSE